MTELARKADVVRGLPFHVSCIRVMSRSNHSLASPGRSVRKAYSPPEIWPERSMTSPNCIFKCHLRPAICLVRQTSELLVKLWRKNRSVRAVRAVSFPFAFVRTTFQPHKWHWSSPQPQSAFLRFCRSSTASHEFSLVSLSFLGNQYAHELTHPPNIMTDTI